MSEIVGEKISLGKLFSDEFFFCIPEYQRPYSWQKEHCEQLFDDINESNRNNEYFLGTIILQEVEKIGTGRKYDIIDGQQRITTLQLFLACLRDLVEDFDYKEATKKKIYQKHNPVDGIPEKVRLEVREKEFFRKYVQEEGSTSKTSLFSPDNDAQKNMKIALNTFSDRANDLTKDEIKSLIEHISQRCIVIYVATKNFEDAYRLFTIINDRGLQLRRIDILKTNNLEPSLIPDVDERKKYANIWETMENDLGSDSFEDLIAFIRTIEVKEKAKEDLLKEYNKLIFAKNKIEKGKGFIDYVHEYKDIYQKVILDKSINLNTDTVSYKNLLNIMNKFLPSNEWTPCVLYFYKKYQTSKLLDFIMKLENKFVADWVMSVTPTKRIVNINSILRAIDQSNHVDELLQNDCFQYDKTRLIEMLNQDVYSSRYNKYILLKLEYSESEHNVERKYGTISIEHVLPQNPKSNGTWVSNFDFENRIYWTNRLANLILLSQRKNSKASNLDFKNKKESYFKGKITDLARSQKILGYSEWTPEVLVERQKEIINLLNKVF